MGNGLNISYLEFLSKEKYWYKVPNGGTLTISKVPGKKQFNLKFDKSESAENKAKLAGKKYIWGFRDIDDPRPGKKNGIKNPFDN
jgi:hypothetical protein